MPEESTDVRSRILREAARLFSVRGYHGVAMREVAEAVGLSKPGIYHHFRDKEDLFLALLNEHLDQLYQQVYAARQHPTIRAQVQIFATQILAAGTQQGAMMRMAGQELEHLGEEARKGFAARYHERFVGQIEAMLQAGMEQGELRTMDARQATWIMLGMLYPFVTQNVAPHAAPQIAERITQVFFDGIGIH